MTIPQTPLFYTTRVVRRRCCTGRIFRAADCRHVADETPDSAERKQRDGWDSVAPISRVEMSLKRG